MRWLNTTALGLSVLLLAGCGFHLRGQAELTPELRVIYVQSQQGIGMPPGVLCLLYTSARYGGRAA